MRKLLLASLFFILVSSFSFSSELFVINQYGQTAYRTLGKDNIIRFYDYTGKYFPEYDFSVPGKYKDVFVTLELIFLLGEDNIVRVYDYTGKYFSENNFTIPNKYKEIFAIQGGLCILGEDNIVRTFMAGYGHIPESDFTIPTEHR